MNVLPFPSSGVLDAGQDYRIDSDYSLTGMMKVPRGSSLTVADGANLSVDSLCLDDGSSLIIENSRLVTSEICTGNQSIIAGSRGRISPFSNSSIKMATGVKAELDLRSVGLDLGENGSLTLGAGSILHLDTEVLAAAAIDSPAGASLIDAPERHVLDVKSFSGQWHAPKAYAQWFIDDPEGDWAPAINNALKIDTEAVHLPGRLCRISKTIQMPVKSRLIGCTRGETKIGNETYFGTVLMPLDSESESETSGKSFIANILIMLNIRDEYFVESYDEQGKPIYISDSEYASWIKTHNPAWSAVGRYPTPLAQIKDIYFFGYNAISSGTSNQRNNTRRGIFVAGAATFEGLVFRGFQQAIQWSYDYADAKEVHHCAIHEPRNIEAAKEVYAVDMGFLGDAMIFEGNHIAPENNKALSVNSCGGGIINANILNADILINNSKGIVYSGNHSESGPQLTIRNSDVEVRGNYFEKGERPNIRIESGQYGNSSVVSLNGNIYCYFTQSNRPSCLNPGQDIELSQVSEYDIEVYAESGQSTLTALNISNEMRAYIPAGAFGNMHTTGIAICRAYKKNDEIQTVAVTEFNSRSQILSRDCKLAILWNNANRVQYPPFKIENISNPKISFGLTSGIWNESPQSYSYKASIIYDTARRIGTGYAGFKNINAIQGNSVIITLSNADATCGKQAMVRIHRENGSVKQYVDVPMCVAANCYDIGTSINGFKWKTGDGDIQFLSTIVSLEYRGDNVVAWSTAKITDTTGWQRGDIIYNVGTDTSWSMQIIK